MSARNKMQIDVLKLIAILRTLESVYEELVIENVIKRPQDINLDEYYGEYSYLGTTLRENMIEPQPSLSDVKQLVTLYGILPLGKCIILSMHLR